MAHLYIKAVNDRSGFRGDDATKENNRKFLKKLFGGLGEG